jgi:hypothetical protein
MCTNSCALNTEAQAAFITVTASGGFWHVLTDTVVMWHCKRLARVVAWMAVAEQVHAAKQLHAHMSPSCI